MKRVACGDDDPAAGDNAANVKLLIDRYKALGLKDLTAKLYPGARHEILTEGFKPELLIVFPK